MNSLNVVILEYATRNINPIDNFTRKFIHLRWSHYQNMRILPWSYEVKKKLHTSKLSVRVIEQYRSAIEGSDTSFKNLQGALLVKN